MSQIILKNPLQGEKKHTQFVEEKNEAPSNASTPTQEERGCLHHGHSEGGNKWVEHMYRPLSQMLSAVQQVGSKAKLADIFHRTTQMHRQVRASVEETTGTGKDRHCQRACAHLKGQLPLTGAMRNESPMLTDLSIFSWKVSKIDIYLKFLDFQCKQTIFKRGQ